MHKLNVECVPFKNVVKQFPDLWKFEFLWIYCYLRPVYIVYEYKLTCGDVSLPDRSPITASTDHAYSRVSLSNGNPWWENIAWPLTCNPDNARWPSFRWAWSISLCNRWNNHLNKLSKKKSETVLCWRH